ncbi:MAG: phosphatase PAP2 family protein [Candidatus Omnitrophica bacterium]|nr:phosphatase PAP2 family protein [Candidatus Omnitrophota bacterium]
MTNHREKSSLIFLLLTAFSILTILVAKQVTRSFDLAATQVVQRLAFRELDYGMYLFTVLGSIEFSCFALLTISWYLYRKYQWPGVFLYLFFFMALSGVEYIWKYVVIYTAPGPEFSRHPFPLGFLLIHTPYSFPSGHAFRSVFLLGIWYQRLNQRDLPVRSHIFLQKVIIVVLILGVGFSRVYLGDHWLSDVVGGMILSWIGLALVSQSPHYEPRPA